MYHLSIKPFSKKKKKLFQKVFYYNSKNDNSCFVDYGLVILIAGGFKTQK
jgi:hypothetical protein